MAEEAGLVLQRVHRDAGHRRPGGLQPSNAIPRQVELPARLALAGLFSVAFSQITLLAQGAQEIQSLLTYDCMQVSGADLQRCSCYANVSLGLLNQQDIIALSHGQETAHSLQVNALAKARCGIR